MTRVWRAFILMIMVTMPFIMGDIIRATGNSIGLDMTATTIKYLNLSGLLFAIVTVFVMAVKSSSRYSHRSFLITLDYVGYAIVLAFVAIIYLQNRGSSSHTEILTIISLMYGAPFAYMLLKEIIILIYKKSEPTLKSTVENTTAEKTAGHIKDVAEATSDAIKKTARGTEQVIKRDSTADELMKWHRLKERGAISEEEFERRKENLLKD